MIKEKSRGVYISHRELIEILKRRLHKIPRSLHYVVIEEMIELKLIKKHGRTRELYYEVIGGDADKCLKTLPFN